MENHFPKDIAGIVRDYMYGQKNTQNHTHKRVLKDIKKIEYSITDLGFLIRSDRKMGEKKCEYLGAHDCKWGYEFDVRSKSTFLRERGGYRKFISRK